MRRSGKLLVVVVVLVVIVIVVVAHAKRVPHNAAVCFYIHASRL
jgi:hypothetical protein